MPAALPAKVLQLNGRREGVDSGGRPIKPTPTFKRIPPKAPEWLSKPARQEWDRVVPEMARLELLKESDQTALAAYCETYAEWLMALATLRREGRTIEAKQGMLSHPAVGQWRALTAQLRAFANEFGLTPASERKLAADTPEVSDAENPFGG